MIVKEGKYNINMLIDDKNGITLKVWMTFFNASPGYLLHLQRKALDWRKDYDGLTKRNYDAIGRQYDDARAGSAAEESPAREHS